MFLPVEGIKAMYFVLPVAGIKAMFAFLIALSLCIGVLGSRPARHFSAAKASRSKFIDLERWYWAFSAPCR